MKSVLLATVALIACFTVSVVPAVAGERTLWVGRDIDNNRVFWTCSNIDGDDWQLEKRDGGGALACEGVTSTDDYVELQVKGSPKFDRIRLYKNRMSMNQVGS